jgi:16S rRNA (guanine966-N2)-methyltransferase
VREALFGILESAGAVRGARVLDLYAGTGALGLEALSRGAVRAVLVESSREALAAVRDNVASLDLGGQARVLAGDVRDVVRRLEGEAPFDLVLADPPWPLVDTGEVARALAALVASPLLALDALVVLEHSSRGAPPEVEGLSMQQSRRYGDASLTFYKPAILAPPRNEEGLPPE